MLIISTHILSWIYIYIDIDIYAFHKTPLEAEMSIYDIIGHHSCFKNVKWQFEKG